MNINGKITINNRNLATWYNQYSIKCVSLEVVNKGFGVFKTHTFEKGKYIKSDDEVFQITMTLKKFEGIKPINFDDYDIKELKHILYSEDIMQVETNEGIYYLLSDSAEINKRDSYITIECTSISPYKYGCILLNKAVIMESLELKVRNIGINEVYADMNIKMLAKRNVEKEKVNVKISNLTNGNSLELTVNRDESITIRGLEREIIGADVVINDTVALKYGENRLLIETDGRIEFKMLHQPEFPL